MTCQFCERLKFFYIKCDFKMVLITFFFAFLHTIKLPRYIWKGNLLLLKCIPSFSHERRILGPLLECRLWLAVVHPTVKYTTISAVFCITTMVSVSTVQSSLNQEFLCPLNFLNVSVHFEWKTQRKDLFYMKSNAWMKVYLNV